MNKFNPLTSHYLYILHRNISYRERRTYVFYGILAHELVVYSKEKASWEYLIRSLRTLHLKQDIFMGPSEQRFPVALSHQKPSNHLDWLSCVCSFLEKAGANVTIPVLYTVSQQVTFWIRNYSVWAVWAVRAVRKKKWI